MWQSPQLSAAKSFPNEQPASLLNRLMVQAQLFGFSIGNKEPLDVNFIAILIGASCSKKSP